MKFKSTYIIGIICVALLAYVYFFEIRGGAERERERFEKNRILRFDRNSVEKVVITRNDTAMVFVKQNNVWMVQEPVNYKGDDKNIEEFLDIIAFAGKETSVSDDSTKYESFGLKAGAVKVSVFLTEGSEFMLTVGQLNPVGSSVYAKNAVDPQVYLTSSLVKTAAEQPLIYFRNRIVIEIKKEDIDKLVFHQKGKEYIVEKQENKWKLVKPIQNKADDSFMEKITTLIANKEVKQFIEENPTNLAQYGLQKPENWVEFINSVQNVKKTIYIGNYAKPYFYGKNDSKTQVFLLDSAFVTVIKPELFDLRDKQIVSFDLESIDVLKIAYPKSSYTFEKNDSIGLWEVVNPVKGFANSVKMVDIMKELLYSRAVKFIEPISTDLKKYGLEPPDADFTLLSKGKEIARLQLGKLFENNRYLYNKKDNVLYLVRPGIYENIVLPQDKLISKE